MGWTVVRCAQCHTARPTLIRHESSSDGEEHGHPDHLGFTVGLNEPPEFCCAGTDCRESDLRQLSSSLSAKRRRPLTTMRAVARLVWQSQWRGVAVSFAAGEKILRSCGSCGVARCWRAGCASSGECQKTAWPGHKMLMECSGWLADPDELH